MTWLKIPFLIDKSSDTHKVIHLMCSDDVRLFFNDWVNHRQTTRKSGSILPTKLDKLCKSFIPVQCPERELTAFNFIYSKSLCHNNSSTRNLASSRLCGPPAWNTHLYQLILVETALLILDYGKTITLKWWLVSQARQAIVFDVRHAEEETETKKTKN